MSPETKGSKNVVVAAGTPKDREAICRVLRAGGHTPQGEAGSQTRTLATLRQLTKDGKRVDTLVVSAPLLDIFEGSIPYKTFLDTARGIVAGLSVLGISPDRYPVEGADKTIGPQIAPRADLVKEVANL